MNRVLEQENQVGLATVLVAMGVVGRREEKEVKLLPASVSSRKTEEGPRLFFDVRKYAESDLGRILLENRLAEIKRRVAPFELRFGANGKPELPVDEETELGRIEVAGMMEMRQLALMGHRHILWMSPCGGNSKYEEDRMVVAEVKEIGKDGRVVLECRGICCKYSREEFWQKAQKMMMISGTETLGMVGEVDDLRLHPMAIKSTDCLPRVFGEIGDVWEAIEAGEDLRKLAETLAIAREVGAKFGARMRPGLDREQAILLGAEIERYIRRAHGISLMAGGNHGMSNEAAMGGRFLAFNVVYVRGQVVTSETPGAKRCKKCGAYYVGDECPYC